MIYAKNAQTPEANKGFQAKYEYKLDKGIYAVKLTLNVRAEENAEGLLKQGPIILEVTESPQYVFEENEFAEQYLELGFWSKAFATPITGWRIRAAGNLPGLVDMVAYG